jgi:hypothetical protein
VSITLLSAPNVASCQTAYRHLKPGGTLMLSASGASEDINEQYKALYTSDLAVTSEYRTYLSRSAAGTVLYMTHHFTSAELADLLGQVGFADVSVHEALEASSRRPEEDARFFYVVCTKPSTLRPPPSTPDPQPSTLNPEP